MQGYLEKLFEGSRMNISDLFKIYKDPWKSCLNRDLFI